MQTKIKTKTLEVSGGQNLKSQFDQIKSAEIATTKTVRVLYKSCCGCGCDTHEYDITIPINSPLKNGDHVSGSQLDSFNRKDVRYVGNVR